jgi:hypothetical protein
VFAATFIVRKSIDMQLLLLFHLGTVDFMKAKRHVLERKKIEGTQQE